MSNKTVSDLRKILLRLRRPDFILRVGLKREQNDENNIDLLVGYDEGDAERYLSQIQTLLESQWPDANLSISDDAIRLDLGISFGGIAVCDSTRLVEQIKEWIDGKNLAGQHRAWVVGYWLPRSIVRRSRYGRGSAQRQGFLLRDQEPRCSLSKASVASDYGYMR